MNFRLYRGEALAILLGVFLCGSFAFAGTKEDVKKNEVEKMLCVSNEEMDKILVEKNYDVVLAMTNQDGVVESIWAAGQNIVITAAVPNQPKSCLLATMSKVTYNPKAIEEIWETYKKQTKQKDI